MNDSKRDNFCFIELLHRICRFRFQTIEPSDFGIGKNIRGLSSSYLNFCNVISPNFWSMCCALVDVVDSFGGRRRRLGGFEAVPRILWPRSSVVLSSRGRGCSRCRRELLKIIEVSSENSLKLFQGFVRSTFYFWRIQDHSIIQLEGCRHSLLDSSVPSILPPWVWVPNTQSVLLSIYIDLCHVEKTNINKRARDWPI